MTWEWFIELFTAFWFYVGVIVNVAIIAFTIDKIYTTIKRKLQKTKKQEKHTVDYSYLEDPDYYGD